MLDLNGELTGAAQDIEDMIWILQENASGVPLYTSDFPVAGILSNESNPPGGVLPIGTRIEFPLSPTLVLRAFDRRENQNYAQYDNQILTLPAASVNWLNALQVCMSEKAVFSTANDFSFAQQLCTSYDLTSGDLQGSEKALSLHIAGASPL